MKSILLTFIALILSSNCLSGIDLDKNKDGIKRGAHEGKFNQIDKFKTQIIDLNDDVLYLIFENVQLNDLINIATAIPEFSPITSNIFRRTYPKELLIFVDHRRSVRDFYQKYKNLFLVYDLQLCLNVLKQFGGGFQSISIGYLNMRTCDREIITEFMNKHSSKTLKQLKLQYAELDVLDHFTVPFEEVEEFTCDIRYSKHVKGPMPWNQLLPKLRRMTLAVFTSANFSFIDCGFPYLEHLSLEIVRPTWDKINVIEGLIRKNPQLKSIILKGTFPAGFAKVIEPLLPNLENLSLSRWEIGEEFVRFENVKFFEFYTGSGYSGSIEKLLLPSLESLKLHYTPKYMKEFFKKHTHLSHLFLVDSGCAKLNELTIDLINLVDVTIQTHRYVLDKCDESIIQFIKSRKKLQRVYFSVTPTESTDVIKETLREQLQDEWIIDDCRQLFRGVCIERKILM